MRDERRKPMVATCSRGLEEVLAAELESVGAEQVVQRRGAVVFAGSLRTLYAANLWLRTAVRVLRPLAEGRAGNRDALYRLAAGVAWDELLRPDRSIAVDVAGSSPGFANTSFAAQVVKDAVVDRMRARCGQRPSVDRKQPDVRVYLHLSRDGASLGLDSSGEPLPHRGYRPRGGPAPLSEALAAGVLLLAGYDGSEPFLDPMCGTGTIAVEAALIATRTAPGLGRSFAFERWRHFDRDLFERVRRDAGKRCREAPAAISANDSEGKAVQATQRNLVAAYMHGIVNVQKRNVAELSVPPGSAGIIVSNPPYGKRVGDIDELRDLYSSLGDRLKHHATGWTAWLLLGERELAKEIGLRATRRIPLFNGPIECRLMRFDMYEGTRKATSSQ